MGNGGHQKSSTNSAPRTEFQPRAQSSLLFASDLKTYVGTTKDPGALKYFGDGKGRDSYVVEDSGGMIPMYVGASPDKFFFGNLRKSS